MMKQQDIGERISVFAESLHAEESPELRALEREALEEEYTDHSATIPGALFSASSR